MNHANFRKGEALLEKKQPKRRLYANFCNTKLSLYQNNFKGGGNFNRRVTVPRLKSPPKIYKFSKNDTPKFAGH